MDQKHVFLLEGLGCAVCAARMEEDIKNTGGVAAASIDFVTRRLTITTDGKRGISGIMADVRDIVGRIEPDTQVVAAEDAADTDPEVRENKIRLARLAVGGALFIAGLAFRLKGYAELAIFLTAWLISGGEILWKAVRNILKGQVFDENFLMGIATTGAFFVGEYPEGAAVMLFFEIGDYFQTLAVHRSRRSIGDLMDIRPDFANLSTDEGIKKVAPGQVSPGDIIVVKPGERVPLDGVITEGSSSADTSALTGESVPKDLEPGDRALSGYINLNSLLTIKVDRSFGESTVSKILDLVRNASSRKAKAENFITRFARYYTPAVVAGAAALAVLPPLLAPGESFKVWIYRALLFLVISCPCALVVSIPLSFFGGIGGASRRGILVKGGNYLEALNSIDTVVFDKTGTLTKGVFEVCEIIPGGGSGFDAAGLLKLASQAESYSNHPIALSIVKEYGAEPDKSEVKDYEELPGHGVRAVIGGQKVIAGNAALMARENVDTGGIQPDGTVVFVAVDGIFAGYITIADKIKDDAAQAIAELKALGIKKTAMLTGDSKAVADRIGAQLDIDEIYADLLPEGKVETVEMLQLAEAGGGRLAFAGDGINDAPVLARADIGVAMGGLGSDAAIEAADVVIMTDEPSRIATAVRIARKTRKIIQQNILFALGVKFAIMALGAFGVATMWEAVFADAGVAVIAVINSMRAMKTSGL